ncbi:esterase/lipase family protein [Kitasatospora phosalacinea]|uniref:Esterase/lipase family protein n=1 Tax=Kitasatospora phosalacinea TaxID=2065 RepID=A0ABW6GS10_9ACTN
MPLGTRIGAALRCRSARALIGCAAVLPALAVAAAAPASAADLPVPYVIAAGAAPSVLAPDSAPPGANDWSCQPSAAHPRPVVLVPGTFENARFNWDSLAPLLKNNGYCVFAINYGDNGLTGSPIKSVAPVANSAAELAAFVDRVLAATHAGKVDLVGHSQGGMMPRYYLKFLGGAPKVGTLVGLAPSNHGTTLDGLTTLEEALGTLGFSDFLFGTVCDACVDQANGSPFMTNLNAGGDTVPGVSYTVVSTRYDLVATPYTSQQLSGPNVTNLVLQDQCALDFAGHVRVAFDPIALTDVLNALDPAHPRPVPCLYVPPSI